MACSTISMSSHVAFPPSPRRKLESPRGKLCVQPPAFPPAVLSGCRRLSNKPLVLQSMATGRIYCVDPNDNGKECQFGGRVLRGCEGVVEEAASARHWRRPLKDIASPKSSTTTSRRRVFVHKSNELYAFKIIPRAAVASKAETQGRKLGDLIGEDPYRELAALTLANADGGHPHVEQLVEALADQDYIIKITPWYGLGEAFDAVPMSEDNACRLAQAVLEGAAFLHARGICHRDISLENVMLERLPDGSVSARIVDLGMAVAVPRDGRGGAVRLAAQGRCGKPAYISPEVFADRSFDAASADIWSCACVVYAALLGIQPWKCAAAGTDPLYRAIAVHGKLAPLLANWGLAKQVSPAAVDLLQRLLLDDPSKRLTSFDAALQHPWFAAIGARGGGGGGGDVAGSGKEL